MATFRPPVFSRQPAPTLPRGVLSQPLGATEILNAPAAATRLQSYDWQNPRGPSYPIANLTHLDTLKLNLRGQDKFFAGAGVGPEYDWPNPRGPQYAASLRVFSDPLKLNLLGKDKFFWAAGDGPNYDWPNPRGPQYASSLRVFSDPLKLNLLGKDKFFGAAGQVPPNTDWPVPRAWPPVVHYWWPTPNVLAGLLSVIAPKPFNLGDWPNPTLARDAAGVAIRAWNDTWQNIATVHIQADTPGDITDTDILQKPINVVMAGDLPIKAYYSQNDVRPMNLKYTTIMGRPKRP